MSFTPCTAKITEPSDNSLLRARPTTAEPMVLVAEDHEDTRVMLRTLLELRGCRVVEARNGLEAIHCARREQPALILMDGSLPLIDGLEATRLIREDGRLSAVVIIGLNGWGAPSYHTAALAAGCDDCLEKPINFERLDRHLACLFELTSPAA